MKKYIILVFLFFISSICLSAQSYYEKQRDEVKCEIILNAGYNITGNRPVFGAKVGFEIFCLRADFDIDATYIDHPLSVGKITTVSPSVGVFCGKKHKVYALAGVQCYGLIQTKELTHKQEDYFRSDHIYWITKIGYQYSFFDSFFLCCEAHHLYYKEKAGTIHFPNTNIRIGIGYRF